MKNKNKNKNKPVAGPVLLLLAAVGAGPVLAGEAWAPVTLEDPETGRAVVLEAGPRALHLVLFATWCPTCLEEMDGLTELESRWGPGGYELVLIAVATRHTSPKLARFIEQRRPPGRVLFDSGGEAQRALDAPGLPTHVLLDSQGRELLRTSGLDREIEQKVEQLVRSRRGRSGG